MVMERVIRAQVVEFLESGDFLDSGQHGCRPGCFTLTQLIYQYDKVLDLLVQGLNVDLIYLDYEKVFDKVDLGLLLKK